MENDEYFINNLWGKYDQFERNLEKKIDSYQNLIKYIDSILFVFDNHKVNLTLKKNEINIKSNNICDIFFNFEKSYIVFLDNHIKFICMIKKILSKYIQKTKEIKPEYIDLKQNEQILSLELSKYTEFKAKYQESALEVETTTLEKIKNYEPVEISRKLKEKVEINLNKYQLSLEQSNKILEEYNTKQKNLIKKYVEMEEFDLKIYYSIINNFQKIERDKTMEFLCSDYFNQLIKDNGQKNINLELKEKLKRRKDEKMKKPRKPLEFEPHKSQIDFNSCLGNEDFNNYLDALDVIKNKYNVKFEVDVETEKKKNSFRELLKKFFELDSQNSEIPEDNINKYYDYLKIPSAQIIFIKILSNLRTNSKFKKNKNLIDILGNSIQIFVRRS